MAKKETSIRGSCSVYLDMEKKRLVDVTGPLYDKNLSQVLDDALTEYLKQYAPLELLDLEIRRQEEQLAYLKSERSKFSDRKRITEVIQATSQQQAQEVRQQQDSLNKMRDDKFENAENVRSLAYQVQHKTIDWNLIKTRYCYDSAIDAREDVLTRLLALGKIQDKDCSGV
jgi:hypothetical protein